MGLAMTTPMMAQWKACKEKAGDAILLFRLGDFYEAFEEDAKILSDELDITLTKRGETPMAGIPHHSAEGYLDRLLAKGHRVAIAEQIEDPKSAKGLVRREIVRVLTPGTLVSSTLLSDKESNFLACLYSQKSVFGLGLIDISTADFRVMEFTDKKSLLDELCRLRPKELLLPKKWQEAEKELITEVKQLFRPALYYKEEAYFDRETTEELLLRHFKVLTLDGFGLKDVTAAISCAGALLAYVQGDLNLPTDHLRTLKMQPLSSYMWLDIAAQRHLELTHPLQAGQKEATLLYHLDETVTPMGGRLLRHWILHPLHSVEAIQKRQEAIQAFAEPVAKLHDSGKSKILSPIAGVGVACPNRIDGGLPERVGEEMGTQWGSQERFYASKSFATGSSKLGDLLALRGHLSKVRDLERLIMRIETGFASPRDLVGLRYSLEAVPAITSALQNFQAPLLETLVSKISDPTPIAEQIKAAIVDEPPLRLSDGGIFKQGYDPRLDELMAIKEGGRTWVADYQARLRSENQIKTLKVGYTQAFGYFIEVSRGALDKIPAHFQRRQTLVNGERYITEELKNFEHQILQSDERIAALENELFQELRTKLTAHSYLIRQIATALSNIDVLSALAKVAKQRGYCRPLVDESSRYFAEEARHPILELELKESFIPNTIDLDCGNRQLALITGPNMAGKSTYLRQTALLAIMAQIGSFIPAKSAHIGLIDKVFCRIGASDDLTRGQSTFMVEMTETANILNNATSRSLVILDEIGRGTSTYDGISIAWAVAEYLLTSKRAKTLFATHYWEMTELANNHPTAFNLCVAVEETEDGIVFLHKIIAGVADKSYGIHVARLAGLPPSTLKRAEEKLHELEAPHT